MAKDPFTQMTATGTSNVKKPPINQNLHPHGEGTNDGMDILNLLQQMQQGRNQMFQNMRSPMVRRTMGGRVIDENEPEGLDALRDIPHSWEQTYNNTGHGGYGRVGVDTADRPAGDIRHGMNGLTAMKSPFGGGFSGPKEFHGDVETYGGNDEMSKVPTFASRPQHDQNIDQMFNMASLFPEDVSSSPMVQNYKKQIDQERLQQGRPNANAFELHNERPVEMSPQESASLRGVPPGGVPPGYTPFTPTPASAPPQASGFGPTPTSAQAPISPFDYDALQARSGEVMTGDDPGLLTLLGRTGMMTGASLIDWLMNKGIRSGDDRYPVIKAAQDYSLNGREAERPFIYRH